MSTNVPVTIWTPTSGIGEMGSLGGANITTLSGVDITTLSGVQLVTQTSTYTNIPATEWVEDDSQ